MSALRARWVAALAVVFVVLSFVLPLGEAAGLGLRWASVAGPFVFASTGLFTALLALRLSARSVAQVLFICVLAALSALAPLCLLSIAIAPAPDAPTWHSGFWCYAAALLLLAGISVRRFAALDSGGALIQYGTPLLFGAWVLVFWQLLTQALDVPRVLLPAPSVIWHALLAGFGVLAGDFTQTVLHSVLIGLVVGCALGFAVGVLIDRSPFLQRGLLPLAALASTVPLVGIAPIMVMWFGFDWHSKAAVVVQIGRAHV